MKKTFDYIIIGAGSAGCVLANRLSKDKKTSVCLIESGPKSNTWKVDMPSALLYTRCMTLNTIGNIILNQSLT